MSQSVIKRFESLSTQQTLALTALGGIMIGVVLFVTAVIFIEPLIALFWGGGPPVSAGPPPEANAPAHAGSHGAAPHGGPLSGLLLTIFGLISTVVVISLVMIYQTVTFVHDSNSDAEHSENDPLRTLRHRYASGEIDDDEFKRRVNRISETESSSTQEQPEQIPANPDTQVE